MRSALLLALFLLAGTAHWAQAQPTTTTTTLPCCLNSNVNTTPCNVCTLLGVQTNGFIPGGTITTTTTTTTTTTITTTTTTTTSTTTTTHTTTTTVTTTTSTTTLATTTTTTASTTTTTGGGSTTTTTLAPWALNIGGTDFDQAFGIARDAVNNIYVVGYYKTSTIPPSVSPTQTTAGGQDGFVAKLSPTGAVIWSHQFGDTGNATVVSVAVDPTDGNVVIGGQFGGTLDLGGGPLTANGTYDGFIVKLSAPTGAYIWGRSFGGGGSDQADALTVAADGSVLVTGRIMGVANLGGSDLNTGSTFVLNAFLAKYNSAGVHQWSKNFPSTGNNLGMAVTVDGSGNPAIGGWFTNAVNFAGGSTGCSPSVPITNCFFASGGIRDAYVASFTTAGTFRWSFAIGTGDTTEQSVNALAAITGNHICAAGYVIGTVNLGGGSTGPGNLEDAFIRCSDGATGAHLASRRFVGDSTEIFNGIAWDAANGALWATGTANGNVNLGTGALTPIGTYDSILGKYSNPTTTLTPVTARRFGTTATDAARGVAVLSVGNPVVVGYFSGSGTFATAPLTSAGQFDGYVATQLP